MFIRMGKKTTMTMMLLCDKCKKNEVQIYNDCCNWAQMFHFLCM